MSLLNTHTRGFASLINRDLGSLLGAVPAATTAFIPPVDVREEDDRFVIEADLPGVAPADIEITADGGRTWCELACYTGTEDWQTRTVDLSAFEGQTVQGRFHVTSDGAFQKDGVYIDNVSISGDA